VVALDVFQIFRGCVVSLDVEEKYELGREPITDKKKVTAIVYAVLATVIIALIQGEHFPQLLYVVYTMLLGFVAYGLNIFLYVRAQKEFGAAKTSAYYAIAPFVGVILSFVILRESINEHYLLVLFIMIAGSALVVVDTMIMNHSHLQSV
jgi:drug/metabolite transporter (DMT)-like permease